jgi:hypothetical protein
MTLTACAAICADYHYFGLEDGDQCFCGMDLDPSAKTSEANCQLKCSGDSSLVCGGTNRLIVYKKADLPAAPSNPATVGAFSYQSCWTDSVGARSLTGTNEMQAGMTVEMCATFCDGYEYFGVEYGSECYCGNDLAGEAAAEADCSILCAGSASEWCGGPNRLNLYALHPIAPAPSSTAEATPETTPTPTITPGPQLTTVTDCPASSTMVGGPSTSCYWKLPSPCAGLATATQWYIASMSLQRCTMSIQRPFPTAVSSCFPNYFGPTNKGSTIYNCLQTAGLTCSYASDCTTATYTVGQEPTAIATPTPSFEAVALRNPGFESGSTDGWTFTQPLTPFNTQDVSTVRVHSGSNAFRAIFLNNNGHSTVMSQSVYVVPGGNYSVSGWITHDNPTNSNCGFAVYAMPYWTRNLTGTLDMRTLPANTWRQFTSTFQASASYATVCLVLLQRDGRS